MAGRNKIISSKAQQAFDLPFWLILIIVGAVLVITLFYIWYGNLSELKLPWM